MQLFSEFHRPKAPLGPSSEKKKIKKSLNGIKSQASKRSILFRYENQVYVPLDMTVLQYWSITSVSWNISKAAFAQNIYFN